MFGTTDKSGAARKSPHANTRTPGTLKTASRKRGKTHTLATDALTRDSRKGFAQFNDKAPACKGQSDVLKRDVTHKKEPAQKADIPLDVLITARKLGMSVKTFLALAKLDNQLKG